MASGEYVLGRDIDFQMQAAPEDTSRSRRVKKKSRRKRGAAAESGDAIAPENGQEKPREDPEEALRSVSQLIAHTKSLIAQEDLDEERALAVWPFVRAKAAENAPLPTEKSAHTQFTQSQEQRDVSCLPGGVADIEKYNDLLSRERDRLYDFWENLPRDKREQVLRLDFEELSKQLSSRCYLCDDCEMCTHARPAVEKKIERFIEKNRTNMVDATVKKFVDFDGAEICSYLEGCPTTRNFIVLYLDRVQSEFAESRKHASPEPLPETTQSSSALLKFVVESAPKFLLESALQLEGLPGQQLEPAIESPVGSAKALESAEALAQQSRRTQRNPTPQDILDISLKIVDLERQGRAAGLRRDRDPSLRPTSIAELQPWLPPEEAKAIDEAMWEMVASPEGGAVIRNIAESFVKLMGQAGPRSGPNDAAPAPQAQNRAIEYYEQMQEAEQASVERIAELASAEPVHGDENASQIRDDWDAEAKLCERLAVEIELEGDDEAIELTVPENLPAENGGTDFDFQSDAVSDGEASDDSSSNLICDYDGPNPLMVHSLQLLEALRSKVEDMDLHGADDATGEDGECFSVSARHEAIRYLLGDDDLMQLYLVLVVSETHARSILSRFLYVYNAHVVRSKQQELILELEAEEERVRSEVERRAREKEKKKTKKLLARQQRQEEEEKRQQEEARKLEERRQKEEARRQQQLEMERQKEEERKRKIEARLAQLELGKSEKAEKEKAEKENAEKEKAEKEKAEKVKAEKERAEKVKAEKEKAEKEKAEKVKAEKLKAEKDEREKKKELNKERALKEAEAKNRTDVRSEDAAENGLRDIQQELSYATHLPDLDGLSSNLDRYSSQLQTVAHSPRALQSLSLTTSPGLTPSPRAHGQQSNLPISGTSFQNQLNPSPNSHQSPSRFASGPPPGFAIQPGFQGLANVGHTSPPNLPLGFLAGSATAFAPTSAPGIAPTSAPGFAAPGFAPTSAPGFAPTQAPGFAPNAAPGLTPNAAHNFLSGPASSLATSLAPGSAPALSQGVSQGLATSSKLFNAPQPSLHPTSIWQPGRAARRSPFDNTKPDAGSPWGTSKLAPDQRF